MSTNNTIPYNTWGGGVSTYSAASTQVENPYTISNLQYNCKVNSSINIDNRPVITNMANYNNNIPDYTTITSIPSGYLPTDINTSTAQDWSCAFGVAGAFLGYMQLTSLPDPFYDTSNATNMSNMFGSCTNLTTVPNFDTSNVINMRGMFKSVYSLTTVPNFDTSNVIDMHDMFYRCNNLTNVPNFNTSNVTDMVGMFCDCDNLTTVPNFNISNVTDMSWMFRNCSNIKGNLYIKSNTVMSAEDMFYGCSNYTKNIYCHANTKTYNTIYGAMGSNTYNSKWNAYLKTF